MHVYILVDLLKFQKEPYLWIKQFCVLINLPSGNKYALLFFFLHKEQKLGCLKELQHDHWFPLELFDSQSLQFISSKRLGKFNSVKC